MRSKIRIPHTVSMFVILTLIIVFMSWIAEIYNLSVSVPNYNDQIRVQSLLSPEGIRWWLKNVIKNFTNFSPFGMVIIAMFGLGLARHSGFLSACIRSFYRNKRDKRRTISFVIILGILSNSVGDGGYIILTPIAAMLFSRVSLNPIAGIITAYISVACGYSANIFLSTMDPIIAHITQEATNTIDNYKGNTESLCNYFFMSVSVVVIFLIIYFTTTKFLIPKLSKYKQDEESAETRRGLSKNERRALITSFIAGLAYLLIVGYLTFSSIGILKGVNGGLMHSPFTAGLLFIISLGIAIMGVTYGITSKHYQSDSDIVKGIAEPISSLGGYFVITFFAAQMFACLEYSHLDKVIAILGANFISSFEQSTLLFLVMFIIFIAVINLFMVSAIAKWTFISVIFIPLFNNMGVSPEVVQCAFRIGDSSTNAITPFMFYMPLVLTYIKQYDKTFSFHYLLKLTVPYTIIILVCWTLMFVGWILLDIPLGI